MNQGMRAFLEKIRFADPQTYQNIGVVPLFIPLENGAPPYISLSEAMERNQLKVTEVSQGGSVPELLVVNECDQAVIVVDGEELVGAKQNRVVNTSILLPERSSTVIPVSCTEQGRWSYKSEKFRMSEAMMERTIRSRKIRSVTESLSQNAAPRSDQEEVWAGINELYKKASHSSNTSAMSELFELRRTRLNECLKQFPKVEGQTGLLVTINGSVVGMDIVSRPEVYNRLHERLLRSYVLDAVLEPPVSVDGIHLNVEAERFLKGLMTQEEEIFASTGHGHDYRYRTETIAGSALVWNTEVVHATFLTVEDNREKFERQWAYWLKQRPDRTGD